MRASSYAWSLPVMWQRWRSHHSIRHIRKPRDTRKSHRSICYRTGVVRDRSFTLPEYRFSTFCWYDLGRDLRTFIYELALYNPWRYTGCASMIFLHQGFQKSSSDRQTDIHDQNYTTLLHGWTISSFAVAEKRSLFSVTRIQFLFWLLAID